ncbi:hypothetical protein PV04_05765 [Phialophora macrospora]|uniref:Transcription factor domain-containing protein n=1 Tax=Phialophora macrospora TaxID=1851006 RepID=A0A0D2FI61_9EURO|nr:hypothetical protein PV04_05765 [Phialophora macrospora]
MAADRRKQFLFLNQSFSSGPHSQREKELQDADRRAHAARHSRSKRAIPPTDNAALAPKSRLLKKTSRQSVEEVPPDDLPSAKPSRKRFLAVRSRTPTAEGHSSALPYDAGSLAAMPSIGQGNYDPFDTASVAGLPPFIHGILDYCFRNVWPTLSCSDPQTEARLAVTRRQAIREHSFMLHAYIANAAGHNLRLHPPGDPARTLLTQARSYHERKTLEAVSDLLRDHTGPVPEGVLLALFITIFPAGDYDAYVCKYPASPLATAQSLHRYANLDVTPGRIQQIQRLSRLLETRGGVDGVSQREWVHAVILADMFVASRLGVRPVWGWPTPLRYLFDAFHDLVLDPHAFQLSRVLGQGFSCLRHRELLQILMLSCRATLALDLHHRKVDAAPQIWEIARVRNAIQHKLCCLDPPTDLVPSHDDSVYNIVRLAALIYSDLVLFPLGDSASIKPRLAYDLRKALELHSAGHGSPHEAEAEAELMIWCTTMGAIAACGTVHQEWFVERLTQAQREDERLLNWILFQTVMSHYLWWDYVLQPRCWDIWSEATQMVQPDYTGSRSAETPSTVGSQ